MDAPRWRLHLSHVNCWPLGQNHKTSTLIACPLSLFQLFSIGTIEAAKLSRTLTVSQLRLSVSWSVCLFVCLSRDGADNDDHTRAEPKTTPADPAHLRLQCTCLTYDNHHISRLTPHNQNKRKRTVSVFVSASVPVVGTDFECDTSCCC